jgi:hypothetical protein
MPGQVAAVGGLKPTLSSPSGGPSPNLNLRLERTEAPLYRDSALAENYRRPASQARGQWPPAGPWRDARERDGHWRFTGPFRFTIHAAQGGPFRGAEIAVAQQRGSVAFGPSGQHAPGPRPCLIA